MIPFTDADLIRLKERMSLSDIRKVDVRALLLRLEAAEKLAELVTSPQELIDAWRRTKGDKV